MCFFEALCTNTPQTFAKALSNAFIADLTPPKRGS